MSIRITRQCRSWEPVFPLSRRELLPLCEGILQALGLEGSHFALKLVDDGEVARLNAEFLGCTGPTNVLSFPAVEYTVDTEDEALPDDEGYLGEIALSVDTLAREVRLYGQEPREHLVRLLAHAVLHLAGYDHGEEMEDLTDLAVGAIGMEE